MGGVDLKDQMMSVRKDLKQLKVVFSCFPEDGYDGHLQCLYPGKFDNTTQE